MKIHHHVLFGLLIFSLQVLAQPTTGLRDKLQVYLQRAANNGYSGSVLVAQRGEILLEQGFGSADRATNRVQTAQTIFSVGSITKQFTGAAILKLWEQGKLRLEDPISKFFPDSPADKAGINIHQLLTHTAGFPGAIGEDYELAEAVSFAKLAFSTPLNTPPGTVYEYSNVGYSILGIIIEKTSGMGYEHFLHENLWKPAGMKQTGYLLPAHKTEKLAVGYRNGERWGTALDHAWLADGPGWHLRANGGVLSTVGDMYLWYKALKNNVILSKAATEKLFAPHVAEDESGQSHYGYGWVVEDVGERRIIWHNGGNGVYNAFMGFIQSEDFCVVVSSNSNDKISDQVARQIQKIVLHGGELLPEDFIKKYSGRYRLPSGDTFDAQIDETNRLTLVFQQAEPARLLTTDGTETTEEIETVGRRTVQMLEGVQKDDFSLLAKHRGVSLETANERIRPFWQDLQNERGRIGSIELFAVAARRKAGLMLSFVKVNFEKSPLFFMYVWRGENIDDVREMEVLDKVFDCTDGKNTFHAANNNRTVVAETDGKNAHTLRIRLPVGDVVAVLIEGKKN